MCNRKTRLVLAVIGALAAGSAGATTYTDNFSGGQAQLQWLALDDACLTAGTLTGTSSLSNPIIPKCPSGMAGVKADESVNGQGALLLTPASNQRTGAILSAFPPFPMTQGIQITFTTYTYSGDSGGTARNGADGIVFFLTDGRQNPPATAGGSGGSMGYGCSNTNGPDLSGGRSDGIAYGYLGLGIDEFGNFLNSGDNGSVGILNSRAAGGSTANGDNSYQNSVSGGIAAGSGPQYQPERIGLRGAGNTNWAWLSQQNSSYYPRSSPSYSKVRAACSSGKYVASGAGTSNNPYVYKPIPLNYNAIPGGYAVLPNSLPIANNSRSATRNPTPSTSASNIAWPITYRLTISPTGLLNFAYSYNNAAFTPVLTNADISVSNGPIPASLRFGFSAGTGGSNNVHEIACFTASPLQSNASAGSNAVTGKAIPGATQFFLPGFSEDNWWGALVADPMVIQADGSLGIGTAANWDAKCVLTGASPCDTMTTSSGQTFNVPVQSPASRKLYTWNNGGVGLAWTNLSSAQTTALNKNPAGAVDNQGQQRLQWLQGARSEEQLQSPPGNLRARTYVLGDIVNSSPTFVASPAPGVLPDAFQDKVNASDPNPENLSAAQKYSVFASANATRRHVVYVGGNDGYLHAFEAGAYKSDGSYDSSNNDGKELFAYMPYGVLMNKAVNLADPNYKHDYLVDATPSYGDLYYGNAWHTWLVGGVGSAGQEIYALDITDPTNFSASDVVGNWSNNTAGLSHLGNTVGTPIIVRMHNGQWALVFGSGLHDDNNGTVINTTTAGIYLGLIDSTTGKIASFQFLDTGVGSATSPNGVAYVSQADLDGDRVADYLYAGDTQGNVWRFDVTSGNPSQWGQTTSRSLVFTAKDGSGNTQPITTSITVLAVQTGAVTRNMLYFGTGRQTQKTDVRGVMYARGQQTFYGVWDWNMGAWNAMSGTKLASLSSGSITRADLLAQSVQTNPDQSDLSHRYLDTTKAVCWKGDVASPPQCPGTPSQYGWRFDLPDAGPTSGSLAGQREQIIYNPAFIGGAIVVNTAIPPVISAAQCKADQQTGWIMAFNPATGGGFPKGYFPDAGGGFSGGAGSVSGIQPRAQSGGVGTPTSLQYGGKSYLVTQTGTGEGFITQIGPMPSSSPSRVSWRELVDP